MIPSILDLPTEGFYDTALNEASDAWTTEIVPTPTRVDKVRKCAEGLSVNTMLRDGELRGRNASSESGNRIRERQ